MSNKKDLPAWKSLLAGTVAGAVEGFITYPLDYVKTQLQLQNSAKEKRFAGPLDCAVQTVRTRGIRGLYRGVSALVVGNASKAGVRFVAFDQLRLVLEKATAGAGWDGVAGRGALHVVAGLGAGVSEALLVVTPSEAVKMRLVQGASGGALGVVRQLGLRGLWTGANAVVARQAANAAVRMGAYGMLRDLSRSSGSSSGSAQSIWNRTPRWIVDFMNGAIAGTITVYATMPLDVAKTRIQAGTGSGVLRVVYNVAATEGVLELWKGSTPRLGRLVLSGGIVFSVYEQVLRLLP